MPNCLRMKTVEFAPDERLHGLLDLDHGVETLLGIDHDFPHLTGIGPQDVDRCALVQPGQASLRQDHPQAHGGLEQVAHEAGLENGDDEDAKRDQDQRADAPAPIAEMGQSVAHATSSSGTIASLCRRRRRVAGRLGSS